jgi:hypothetical protein
MRKSGGKVEGAAPLLCPRCGQVASAAHFKSHKGCAAVVARLRAMLNVSQRKRAVAGPGRPKGSKTGGGKSGPPKVTVRTTKRGPHS